MGISVTVMFWASMVKLWVTDGPRIPLVLAALWGTGLVLLGLLDISAYIFMAYQALLAVVALMIERYKSAYRGF